MHVPDGVMSNELNIGTAIVAGAFVSWALYREGRELDERRVPVLAMTAAFIFAAQMVNFPIGFGTSGHLAGGVLAALLLGPLNACLVMALVLIIQCLTFQDGGLTALGTNIFNLALIGAMAGFGIFRLISLALRSSFLTAAALAAWLSMLTSAACCAVELHYSGTAALRVALPALLFVHAIIGIGEALITVAVLSLVLKTRPDLVSGWPRVARGAAQVKAAAAPALATESET